MVISIIGLLSSVVLAALGSARDKGRVAAGILFAGNAYQALGAGAIGVWNFNDAPATNWNSTKDISAGGNNITLAPFSGTFSRSPTTPTGSGYSLSLTNGLGNFAQSSVDLTSLNLRPTNFTVSLWVYFTSAPTDGTLTYVDVGNGYDSPLFMYFTPSELHCYSDYLSGADLVITPTIDLNKWHHVACSINATTGKMVTYYDGKQVTQSTFGTYSNFYSDSGSISNVFIGADKYWWGYYSPQFSGFVDDYAFYNSSLAINQVQEIYAEGLMVHRIALKSRYAKYRI